jgi:hypothetical protein
MMTMSGSEQLARERACQQTECELTELLLRAQEERDLTPLEAVYVLTRMLAFVVKYGLRGERQG